MRKQPFFETLKETLFLRGWSLLKVPLINMMGPRVQELNDDRCSILIPLSYWTKNHFNSMYISVQVTGADLGLGMLAMHHIRKKGNKLTLLFKDLHADFKKRPDADTLFTCTEGKDIKALVAQALLSGKREQRKFTILATCPKKYGDEIVAEFKLTLSIKKKK
jgi:hypothetical protein